MNKGGINMDASREELLKQLSALDFTVIELNLFLNTHPRDRNALMKYNTAVEQAKMLRMEFERRYGPLTAYYSTSRYPWQWICNPWPWHYSFNFRLAGEEC
jgi:spore coat protein JB